MLNCGFHEETPGLSYETLEEAEDAAVVAAKSIRERGRLRDDGTVEVRMFCTKKAIYSNYIRIISEEGVVKEYAIF
jgi:hypothetical protein